MKICVYPHPTKEGLIIARFEKLPLFDYCNRYAFYIDLSENKFNSHIKSIVNNFKPVEHFESLGRSFMILEKPSAIKLVKFYLLKYKVILNYSDCLQI